MLFIDEFAAVRRLRQPFILAKDGMEGFTVPHDATALLILLFVFVVWMREFIALEVEDSAALDDVLKAEAFTDRCVKPAGKGDMHLTLNFLGEVDPSVNHAIAAAMDDVCRVVSRYRVEYRGIGAFPSRNRPSVIWVGVIDSGETSKINALLSERLSILGFPAEARPFHPHITLARVKCRVGEGKLEGLFRDWEEKSFGFQEIRKVFLKKSELTPQGAIHTSLHVSRLRT